MISPNHVKVTVSIYRDISTSLTSITDRSALCYPVTKFVKIALVSNLTQPWYRYIRDYLNGPKTRTLLGVSPALENVTFSSCNMAVGAGFRSNMDIIRGHTPYYLENLLDRGIKVLIYVGTYDWICNWVGNEAMVDALEWHGASDFKDQKLKAWSTIKGQEVSSPAGKVKSSGGLTFLTIEGAGHMVCTGVI